MALYFWGCSCFRICRVWIWRPAGPSWTQWAVARTMVPDHTGRPLLGGAYRAGLSLDTTRNLFKKNGLVHAFHSRWPSRSSNLAWSTTPYGQGPKLDKSMFKSRRPTSPSQFKSSWQESHWSPHLDKSTTWSSKSIISSWFRSARHSHLSKVSF